MAEILEVDLLRFEQGDAAARRAVVDGVRRSLATGFVYTSHDVPEEAIDEAYAKLAEFFSMDHATKSQFAAPGPHGETGYPGLLVATAAAADVDRQSVVVGKRASVRVGLGGRPVVKKINI